MYHPLPSGWHGADPIIRKGNNSMNNTLRQRMDDEMNVAGLAASSRQTYLNAVDRLAARSWRSLEELTEKEIRSTC